MMTKFCGKCGVTKPVSEFAKNRTKHDGLQSRCKCCNNIIKSEWQIANRDKKIAAQSAWDAANQDKRRAIREAYRAAHPDRVLVSNQNMRAARISRQGRLSAGIRKKLYALQRGKCACCGNPLGNDYHLDHIMPLALGGTNTDDNAQLLRAICNLQKNATHPIDFMRKRGFLL